LDLHRDKMRVVCLAEGQEGFEFLGCHFHARVSGRLLEQGVRRYYLQRWPSQQAMKRLRQQIKVLTGRNRVGTGLREVISRIHPILRGWGNYFRTGKRRHPLQPDRLVRRGTPARPDAQALWPQSATWPDGHLDACVVRGSRLLPPARHHPLPGSRVVTIMKIIGKPCAGKPHARIERGMGKRA
jgi:RNA-directed DNA polymerase